MHKQRALSSVGLWWRWVLATIFGALIGNVFGVAACLAGVYYLSDRLISLNICHTGFGNLNCYTSTGILTGAIFVSLFVSSMQYLVLRKILRGTGLWIVVGTFGWTWVAFAATSLAYTSQYGFVLNPDGSFDQSNFLDRLPMLLANSLWLVLAGIFLGLLQWIILAKGQQISQKRSLLWPLLTVALAGLMAIAVIAIFQGQGSLYGMLWFFLGFTVVYATISGATLVKIGLHRAQPWRSGHKSDHKIEIPNFKRDEPTEEIS